MTWIRALPFAALAFCLCAPTALAAESGFGEVKSGDSDLGQGLEEARVATAGFIDANNNGRLDIAAPDEPVYLDVDTSRSVSYADLRFTPFLRYPAGSAVDLANRDVGRDLVVLPGWFARDGATWYLDSDGSNSVTAADVRITGALAKVLPGDDALGHPLTASASTKGSMAWLDSDRDRTRGPLEPLFLDTDPSTGGALKVSIGDVRFVPVGLGLDDEATKGDLQALARTTPAPPAGSSSSGAGALGAEPGTAETGSPQWRTLDWILVVVGIANLAGLVVVGRLASERGPRNPFK